MWRGKSALAAVMLAAGGGASAHALSATDVLLAASAQPTASFQGKRLVVHWYGDESHAQEILVYYRAPGLWRQDIVAPSGDVQKVVYQRGGTEWIHDVKEGTLVRRGSASQQAGRFDSARLSRLLLQNYTPRLAGRPETLSGVPCRKLELVPKHSGSPLRTLWVDPGRGIVLKTRQLTAGGTVASETSFTELSLENRPDEAFFSPPLLPADKLAEEIPRETVRGPGELAAAGLDGAPWPAALPNGFELDSVTLVPLGEDEAAHYRYVDGLSVVSFFVSPRPFDEEGSADATDDAGHDDPTFSFASPVGNILTWEKAGRHCLLVGDLETEALRKIQTALDAPLIP